MEPTPVSSHPHEAKPAPEMRPSPLRRVAGLFGLLCAGSIAIAATALGTLTIQDRAAARQPVAPPPLLKVKTLRVRAADHLTTTEHYAGRIEAARTSRLAFERGGTVTHILVDEGAKVRAGDIIARLDTQLLKARVAELKARRAVLEAQTELARLTAERKKKLQDRGFATGQDHDNARLALTGLNARVKEVDAALKAASIDIRKSVLVAPYDGTIAARRLDEGAIVTAGMPVMDLMESARPQIRVGVPQDQAAHLTVGNAYHVDYAGTRLSARLIAVRPDIDPATRTLVALFDLTPSPLVAFGATADLVLDISRPADGFWLPLSTLRSGTRGLWTVLTVVEDETGARVGQESVEILTVAGDRAFVRGTLADGTTLIAEGGHRLVPGTRVRPVEAIVRPIEARPMG